MDEGPRTFGACLEALLRAKRLSPQRLAEQMGYKSKTTVVRILREESIQTSRERLFARMDAAGMLSRDERRDLTEALEVSRVGLESARTRARLRALLSGECWRPEEIDPALEAALGELETARAARILVFNCCWPRLFGRLREILLRRSAHEMRHYFVVGSRPTQAAEALCSLSAIAHAPAYAAFALEAEAQERDGLTGVNALCFSARDRDGVERHTVAVLSEPGSAVVHTLPGSQGAFDFMHRIIGQARGRFAPVVFAGKGEDGPAGFVEAMRFCTEAERGRDLYAVRPDLCLNLIAPEHVRAALTQGGVRGGFPGVDERTLRALIEDFLYFQDQRYQRGFSGDARTYILSPRAMRRFVLTGLLGGHFAGMRPFREAERAAILRGCLRGLRENPRFSIRFWKEEADPAVEITALEGLGVVVLPAGMGDRPGAGDRLAMIRHPQLTKLLIDWFRDDLLRTRVLSREQSAGHLRRLLDGLGARE